MKKVIEVAPRDGFKIYIQFDDGKSGVVDLADISNREVTQSWNDRSTFESAVVTPEGAVEWPGGVDLCGDSLYLRLTGKRPEEILPGLTARVNA
jgi:hypothetical protein